KRCHRALPRPHRTQKMRWPPPCTGPRLLAGAGWRKCSEIGRQTPPLPAGPCGAYYGRGSSTPIPASDAALPARGRPPGLAQ
nr:hypothetical protein [Tanacetum cinerariifolium]